MTPMEGCLYLGIRNTFMVPDGWEIDRRKYNKSFTTLKGVAWECYNAAVSWMQTHGDEEIGETGV